MKRITMVLSISVLIGAIFVSCEKGVENEAQPSQPTNQSKSADQNETNKSNSSKRTSNSKQITEWLNGKAYPVLKNFNDQNETAQNAPRIALSNHVSELKSTRRRWENLSTPNLYMEGYKRIIVSYMEQQIAAFTEFLSDEDPPEFRCIHSKRNMANSLCLI